MHGFPARISIVFLLALSPALAAHARTNPGKAGMEWVVIPGGDFDMGSNGGPPDQRPVHRVSVRTFELAKTEVTAAQYKACVDAGACTAPGTGEACNWGVAGRDNHPINCVDWNQAEAFSKWAGGRLPSEAEWEYAARSAGQDWMYPWGDEPATCERAVISGCSGGNTAPVCSRPRGNTRQGVCDMAGNVDEWVQDRHHISYLGAPSDGSPWDDAGSSRVRRGGSCFLFASFARAAHRFVDGPGSRGAGFGFRPARSIAGPAGKNTGKGTAADAKPEKLSEGKARVDWVALPGGKFDMGYDGGNLNESPVHRVLVKPFEMARTPVTVAQYKACVDAGACTAPGKGVFWSFGCNWGVAGRENHPVNCVDWNQAEAFSRWAGGRLPSEAEWEYAARSAGKNWTYPWGDEKPTCERAVTSVCGAKGTAPVCSKPKGNTLQGLCDLSGNVWEWVRDRYHESYAGAPVDGGAWDDAGSERVMRGGAWDAAFGARAAGRTPADPDSRTGAVGFRPARDARR